jgi:hypothetical protein
MDFLVNCKSVAKWNLKNKKEREDSCKRGIKERGKTE